VYISTRVVPKEVIMLRRSMLVVLVLIFAISVFSSTSGARELELPYFRDFDDHLADQPASVDAQEEAPEFEAVEAESAAPDEDVGTTEIIVVDSDLVREILENMAPDLTAQISADFLTQVTVSTGEYEGTAEEQAAWAAEALACAQRAWEQYKLDLVEAGLFIDPVITAGLEVLIVVAPGVGAVVTLGLVVHDVASFVIDGIGLVIEREECFDEPFSVITIEREPIEPYFGAGGTGIL
jgi:hypothetical protein